MKPLAPEVVGPISVCSKAIEVRGNIAGATIEILVNGDPVVSHDAPTANSAYSINTALTAGDTVTARQKFGGETGPSSLPIIVQDVPSQPSSLTIHTRLHKWGRAALVTGAVSGAKIELAREGQVVGAAEAISGWAKAIYDPPLNAAQTLTLKQSTCNNSTASQVSQAALDLPSKLPAPLIELPLIECQNSISISKVIDGAYVEMYRNDKLEHTFVFSVSKEWFWIKPLKKGDVIKVRQGFKSKKDSPKLEVASPFHEATVHPIDVLHAPEIIGTPCPGTTYITIAKLVRGARVVLTVDGKEIGQTDAANDTFTFTTPPLDAGSVVEVHMELCGNKGPSDSVEVLKSDQKPGKLEISKLYSCASHVYLKVKGSPGNYLVFIANKSGEHISSYYNLVGLSALIPVSPSLIAGEEILIHVQGCGGDWVKNGPHLVGSGAPAPSIIQPVLATNTYCEVNSAAAGAVIDVYVNDSWKGSAISCGNLANTVVYLSQQLKVGDKVHCTQTLCGKTSKPSSKATVQKYYPSRPVLLKPENDAEGVDTKPTFVWEDPGAGTDRSADSFTLDVKTNDTPVISQIVTTTSYQSPIVLGNNQTFTWTVTSVNGGGSATPFQPFTFKTKNAEAPPESRLGFVPPITSGAGGSYPRGIWFDISIEVKNTGNQASPDYSVLFAQRTSDGAYLLADILTVNMPSLGADESTLATAAILINETGSVRLDVILMVGQNEIDSAFRIV